MDGRINNKGTKGNKGGRPSKAEEQKLIENLTPMNADALKSLQLDENNALYFLFSFGCIKVFTDRFKE